MIRCFIYSRMFRFSGHKHLIHKINIKTYDIEKQIKFHREIVKIAQYIFSIQRNVFLFFFFLIAQNPNYLSILKTMWLYCLGKIKLLSSYCKEIRFNIFWKMTGVRLTSGSQFFLLYRITEKKKKASKKMFGVTN